MPAPDEFVVDKVLGQSEWSGNKGKAITYEIVFQGSDEVWKAHRFMSEGHPEPKPGEALSGWKNDGYKFGMAKPKGSGNGSSGGSSAAPTQGRDDAVGKSIERQVAAYCTARIVAANMGGKLPGLGANNGQEFAAYVEYMVDTFANAIAGKPEQTQIPTPEPGGASTAAGDESIPF